jgi:hypothetical protein
LVLSANRLAQHVDLDLAGLLGQESGGDHPVSVAVQGREQADGQSAAGTHAGARRNIADGRDFQRLVNLHAPHRLAD